jgi:putative nucleotidyltransferase with HDIG domain
MREVQRQETIFGFSGTVVRVLAVAILVLAIMTALVSIPERSQEWVRSEELVRKLFLIPILLCALWFGMRGAAIGTAVATAVSLGMVGTPMPEDLPGQAERIGETGVFWLVGALASRFFEQQRKSVQDIEAANENTLLALASSLDVREHNTGVHSQRVADYTLRLAKELRVKSRESLDIAWRGALLHDIGKHSRRGAAEARTPDRRGVEGDADASRRRGGHPAEDRVPPRAGRDRPFPP